jgi:hypothetical protein
MHRNHLSYRRVRTTRRYEIRFEEVIRFEEELSTAYRDLPKTHIVNVDEFMWLLLWQPRKTAADTGVEPVEIETDGDPRTGFTLIGSIAANRDTLPLFLLAKGRLSRCYKQGMHHDNNHAESLLGCPEWFAAGNGQ